MLSHLLGSLAFLTLVVMAVSVVLLALMYRLQRRPVWPYVAAIDAPSEQIPPTNLYASEAAGAAAEAGFIWRGTFADGRGKPFLVRYDLFRSPEGDVIAIVGTGTTRTGVAQITWMITLRADGRGLMTFDNPGNNSPNLTGHIEEASVRGVGFSGLLEAHRARIAALPVPVEPFVVTGLLDQLQALQKAEAESMVAQGYATFVDAEQTLWRYSLKGAMVIAFLQYFGALRRIFVPNIRRSARKTTRSAAA